MADLLYRLAHACARCSWIVWLLLRKASITEPPSKAEPEAAELSNTHGTIEKGHPKTTETINHTYVTYLIVFIHIPILFNNVFLTNTYLDIFEISKYYYTRNPESFQRSFDSPDNM